MFCADHHRQASTFSMAFGKQDELPTTGADTSGGSRGTVSGTDRASFRDLILGVFEHVVAHCESQDEKEAARWPQISVYFLNDHWHARPYYAIVPRRDGEENATVVPFTMADARPAFKPGRPIFDTLAEQFEAHLDELEKHQLQQLDIHFITYAGVIAINAHQKTSSDRNLATFKLENGEFVPTDLDEVQGRLRRPAW